MQPKKCDLDGAPANIPHAIVEVDGVVGWRTLNDAELAEIQW